MATVLSGCHTIQGPDWTDPGSAANQQFWAQVFDPYPEDEPGPQIMGARPRDFDRAPPEVDRARHFSRAPNW
jgi:hypothetical protein